MQNAKDTFYLMLQGRLAALNPARTMVVRGTLRPGTLVDENELPTAAIPTDTFRLRWTALQIHTASPLPWVNLQCSITYATDGSTVSTGMDRGRLLSAMDAELSTALSAAPRAIAKQNHATTPPTPMLTNIFWVDPVFAPAVAVGERLERTATVQVFAYQEAGEL
jgi:hypothetical protein